MPNMISLNITILALHLDQAVPPLTHSISKAKLNMTTKKITFKTTLNGLETKKKKVANILTDSAMQTRTRKSQNQSLNPSHNQMEKVLKVNLKVDSNLNLSNNLHMKPKKKAHLNLNRNHLKRKNSKVNLKKDSNLNSNNHHHMRLKKKVRLSLNLNRHNLNRHNLNRHNLNRHNNPRVKRKNSKVNSKKLTKVTTVLLMDYFATRKVNQIRRIFKKTLLPVAILNKVVLTKRFTRRRVKLMKRKERKKILKKALSLMIMKEPRQIIMQVITGKHTTITLKRPNPIVQSKFKI